MYRETRNKFSKYNIAMKHLGHAIISFFLCWMTKYSYTQSEYFCPISDEIESNKCDIFDIQCIGVCTRVRRIYALSTKFQLYLGGQFYWWRKLKYLWKTTDLYFWYLFRAIKEKSEVKKYLLNHYKSYFKLNAHQGLSWSQSYGSWIYNYLCNQCISPLTLWVQIPW
jgi:hypothetical protein